MNNTSTTAILFYDAHMNGQTFTTDWFSQNIPVWLDILKPLAHQPHLSCAEVGSWEGRSACWLLENIVTHPTSRLVCIDTFQGSGEHYADKTWKESLTDLEQRFRNNIAATGASDRATIIKGESALTLHSLPAGTFDCIYIDGSHIAADVLTDIIQSWLLLKPGGILICDDYHWDLPSNPLHRPKPAIDTFLFLFKEQYEVLHEGYQIIVRKTHPYSHSAV